MDNRTLAGLLAATPPADLRKSSSSRRISLFPTASWDLDAAAARQAEVELACTQAQDYAAATRRLLGAIEMATAAPPLLSNLAETAPAASAVAARADRPAGLRRGLRLVHRVGAPPFSRRG